MPTLAAVEQYTGEGEPPYCEMTLRAINDKHNANFMVTLIGAQPPNNTIRLKRTLELLLIDGAQVSSLGRL